jgi:glycosyltransferase involved in cell wall biosynthesis
LLNWQASNSFGWGLLAQGLVLHWASDPQIQAMMGFPLGANDFPCMDVVRGMTMNHAASASNHWLSELTAGRLNLRERGVMVMDALGNGFLGPNLEHQGIYNVGRCVFEDTSIDHVRSRLAKYDSLLCASRWNADMLRAITTKPVAMIHEGVDHGLFFPGPRSGLMESGRFRVFSGGKIEFRKGHDLVILAFREFARRHADAVLVAAWHCPWPQVSAGFQGRLDVPLGRNARGELEVERWVTANGIAAHQFIELPRMPNPMLPSILREMDCALQVSRCEPCTNLPAKEAMACAVPVILADNTGTRDLIAAENCVALRSQAAVTAEPGVGREGWGESSVEEIVAALEKLYTDTHHRMRIGQRGAESIITQRRTWRDHATTLKAHLLELSGGGGAGEYW